MTYHKWQRSKRTHTRRGAILALFLVILPVLIVILGFAIDFARMQEVRAELRRSTDLAAKAAARTLSKTDSTLDAMQTAKDIAAANPVAGQPLTLRNSDIEFGYAYAQGDGSFGFASGGFPTNAVKVFGDRSSSASDGGITMFFGSFYNKPAFEPKFTAVSGFTDSDICLVLDRSSSMKLAVSSTETALLATNPRVCSPPYSDSRWVALDQAVDVFLSTLGNTISDEKVGVVTFSTDATSCGTTTPGVSVDQSLTFDTSLVATAMQNRTTGIWNGNTDIAAGIQEGQAMLLGAGARSTAYKYMVVMTDGVYTEDDPIPYAQIAADNGIKIFTITFGAAANQADMQTIADLGSGRHYHADTTTDLIAAFKDLGGTIANLIQ